MVFQKLIVSWILYEHFGVLILFIYFFATLLLHFFWYLNSLFVVTVEDLKANTEYTGYTAASSVVQWFWEVVKGFNKEDMARLLQFVTGTSKVI